MTMTPRERVLCALAHQEPDRVPTALGGSYYSLHDRLYFNLLEELGIGGPVPPFRRNKSRNSNYHDDRVLDILQTDIRYVWLGFDDLSGPDPCTGIDAWGVEWAQRAGYMMPVRHPLANATAEDLDEFPWPEADRLVRLDELRERLGALSQRREYAIAARAAASFGPFEQAQTLRGREQLLIDLIENPGFVERLVTRITAVICRLMQLYLDVAGDLIDIIEIPGDDYGGTNGLLISPSHFDRYFRCALASIVGVAKEHRRDLAVAFHSDGAIGPLLPALVEIGIDIFHPLEPLAANEFGQIKRSYGDQLTFLGGIDIKSALQGSVREVREEAHRCITELGPRGGYILAPANHVQSAPAQNIVALFSLARELGRYPLGKRRPMHRRGT